MSTLWWVGVAPNEEDHGPAVADRINNNILAILLTKAPEPFATITESDGSMRARHRIGGVIVTDFFDRLGTRIGFGIEAADENSARAQVEDATEQLTGIGLEDLISIWTWNRSAVPVEAPELVAGLG